MADCSFCGKPLKKGTGKMYVLKEGTIFFFCSNKCEKNQLILKRNPRFVKWTKAYHKEKSIIKSGLAKKGEARKEIEKKKK